MALQFDKDLGIKAQGPQGAKGDTGERGPQGEAGKIYKPYVTDDGHLNAKLINPDGTDVTASV